jgi:hypothetical protein
MNNTKAAGSSPAQVPPSEWAQIIQEFYDSIP